MQPTATELNLVLITSGIDHLTAKFHRLPATPMAIIELGDWGFKQKLKYTIRKSIRIISPGKYPDCELYCSIHGLRYIRVDRRNKATLHTILEQLNANLVFTYRCPLIPVRYLASLSHGAINLHNSILPDYKGGNPLFWQVLNGEDTIGCTVHYLSDEMDGGDILLQKRFERPTHIHHKDLDYKANADIGFELVSTVIQSIVTGKAEATAQPRHNAAHKAPNCEWSTWRTLVADRQLDQSRIDDIACFVGETTETTVRPVSLR